MKRRTSRSKPSSENEGLGGKELFTALKLLEDEKKIPQEYMLEKLEAALIGAYKREYSSDKATHENVRVVFDRDNQEIRMFQIKTVVENVEDPVAEVSVYEANISGSYRVGDT